MIHSLGGWVSWFLRCIRRFTRRPRLAERSAHPRPAVACEGERVDCLLLDGCNLPLSLLARARTASGFALVSRSEGSEEDWSELLASVAGAPPRPFAAARVLFDGHSAPGRLLGETTERLTAAVDAYATHPGRIADDALVKLVARRALADGAAEEPATPKEAAAALGSASRKLADVPAASADDWFVVRRVGGGERAFARLWRRLGLIRTEACASLLPLTAPLRAQAAVDAHHLCAGADRFVEVRARQRRHLRTVVATDDVLLATRVVAAGGAALTWRQLRALCGVEGVPRRHESRQR